MIFLRDKNAVTKKIYENLWKSGIKVYLIESVSTHAITYRYKFGIALVSASWLKAVPSIGRWVFVSTECHDTDVFFIDFWQLCCFIFISCNAFAYANMQKIRCLVITYITNSITATIITCEGHTGFQLHSVKYVVLY